GNDPLGLEMRRTELDFTVDDFGARRSLGREWIKRSVFRTQTRRPGSLERLPYRIQNLFSN
ncbi:MAG: hypothetical protein E6447_25300, partial [Bradyrhizobium sp.]|nr:hypothetical protein [Bradyrhizobium sp.]